MMVGDLHAQIAVARTGERRLGAIYDRYGLDTVRQARDLIFAQSEALDRAAVAAIPDGVYAADGCMDNDGVSDDPVWIRMKVTIEGDEMLVDLTESDDQTRGAINCGEAQTLSATRVAFRRLINPDRPITGGTFAPLRLNVRKGSQLAAQEPAACQFYFSPLGLLIDLLAKALAPVLPQQVAAASHGDSMCTYLSGLRDRGGQPFVHVECLVGGWGAWEGSDGESSLINSTNGAIDDIPIEIVESRYPVRVRNYAIREGSGGAGKWRGGCGTIRELEIEDDDVWVSLWYERSKTPAWGLFGGETGKPPTIEINPGTPDARRMLKVNQLPLRRGDVILHQTGGGGGFGRPEERDPALRERDRLEGLAT
jgi:N-methylhydantoinase B